MEELSDFKMSATTTKLFKALFELRKMDLHILRDSDNPFFKSKYASLPSVLAELKEPFRANGLLLMQLPLGGLNACRLVNLLIHESGEFLQWIYASSCKPDPQGVGSAITYGRRYNAVAAAGLAEEDDDGNKGSGRGPLSDTVYVADDEQKKIFGQIWQGCGYKIDKAAMKSASDDFVKSRVKMSDLEKAVASYMDEK